MNTKTLMGSAVGLLTVVGTANAAVLDKNTAANFVSVVSNGSTVYRADGKGVVQTFNNFLGTGEEIISFTEIPSESGSQLVALTRQVNGVQKLYEVEGQSSANQAAFKVGALLGTTNASVFSIDALINDDDGTYRLFGTRGLTSAEIVELDTAGGAGGFDVIGTVVQTTLPSNAGGLQVFSDSKFVLTTTDTDNLTEYNTNGTVSNADDSHAQVAVAGFEYGNSGLEEGFQQDGSLFAGLLDANSGLLRIGQFSGGTFMEFIDAGPLAVVDPEGAVGYSINQIPGGLPTPGAGMLAGLAGVVAFRRRRA